ncbi:MAG: hypothetical protein IIX47_00660 [Spirochaetaceae bacterium]|nr:hypothetical protein [Spirochaetaceae bacterium]
MKKFITFLFLILSFSFFGCDFILDSIKNDPFINDYYDEDEDDSNVESIEVDVNFTVQAFSEESVVLQWSTDLSNVRYNIYVKDSFGYIDCVEENYGKKNYFAVGDNKSAYAIGILLDEEEIFVTNFVYPELEDENGFPVYAEISSDGFLGVECLYPSNVDYFSLKGVHENGETYHTKKYSAEELNHYLLPIRYEENSRNNYFTLVFTIGETEYISAKYYFDYAHHEEASKLTEDEFLTFYPSL